MVKNTTYSKQSTVFLIKLYYDCLFTLNTLNTQMTALDKCPLLGFFATASEDGYIKVRIFYLLQMTLK